jgi:uncharacterized membrane protein YcaP (DUF421 family)
METVFRAFAIYVVLLVILRLSGRRTMGQMTAFDFVLLLVIGQATQQALIGDDFSITTAAILIVTLVTTDIGLAYVKEYLPKIEIVLDGQPLILLQDGKPLQDRLQKARVSEADILHSARFSQGLVSLDQIRYAILETDGKISIIPAGGK